MNSRSKCWALPVAAAALFLVFAAPQAHSAVQLPPASPPPHYQVLDTDLSSLRSQFNQDAGHIRIVMLLSPT